MIFDNASRRLRNAAKCAATPRFRRVQQSRDILVFQRMHCLVIPAKARTARLSGESRNPVNKGRRPEWTNEKWSG